MHGVGVGDDVGYLMVDAVGVHRYWRAALLAVPVGALAGLIPGALFFTVSSPRATAGPASTIWYWLAIGAAFGVGTAAAALIGAACTVLVRGAAESAPVRKYASTGAAIGVAVAWGAAAVWAGVSTGLPAIGVGILFLGLLLSLAAAIVARAMTTLDDARRRGSPAA